MTSRILFHSISSQLPRFDWAHESVDSPSALIDYLENHDPTFNERLTQRGRSPRFEDNSEATQLEQDILRDRLRKLRAAESNEDIRTFVTHLCALSDLSLYNAVLALTQKPTATTVLSNEKWNSLGFRTKIGARGIVITHPNGPTSYVYDIEDVEPLNASPNLSRSPASAARLDPYTVVANNRTHLSQCTITPYDAVSEISHRLKNIGIRVTFSDHFTDQNDSGGTFPVSVTPLRSAASNHRPLQRDSHGEITWPPLYRIDLPSTVSPKMAREAAVRKEMVRNETSHGKRGSDSQHTSPDHPKSIHPDLDVHDNPNLRLLLTLLGTAFATTAYKAPWMHSPSNLRRRFQPEESFRQASERLKAITPISTAAFEATLAVYIVGRRFSWDFPVPFAEEFLGDDTVLPPPGACFLSVLQTAHYLEKLVDKKRDYKQRFISVSSENQHLE